MMLTKEIKSICGGDIRIYPSHPASTVADSECQAQHQTYISIKSVKIILFLLFN